MEKQKILRQDGFIAIIALGIFLILSLFGIIVQRVTTDTVDNVMTTIKYNEASDIADSVIEYLQYEMNQREAGFSMDPIDCVYDGSTNPDECSNVDKFLGFGGTEKDIEITMEVKGRNKVGRDNFVGTCPFIFGGGCYSVPYVGTGNAGDNCEPYRNYVESGNWNPNPDDVYINSKGQKEENLTLPNIIKQIDYSCNWNKLSFGSSSTDRVAIPLYYDISETTDPDPIIINPFMTVGVPSELHAGSLTVRVRPPCLPCSDPRRNCASGFDETICLDTERYELDDLENDIVVQWQIAGECDGEPCSLIPHLSMNNEVIDDSESSAITEYEINDYTGDPHVVVSTAFLDKGVDTNNYVEEVILPVLKDEITKPVLVLFLNEKLIESDGNVPYLEYQILTDKPIGSPETQATAKINIGGYVFEKTLSKQEQTSLIDFAVQN